MAEPAWEALGWYRLRAAQVTQGSNVETDKELFMNKQTRVNSASKKIGGQTRAAGSRAPGDITGKGGTAGQFEPASVKTGHDSVKAGNRSLKVGHD
jgi:hypothetical protein